MALGKMTWGGIRRWGWEPTTQTHFIEAGTKNGACTPDRSRKLSIESWGALCRLIGEGSESETRIVAEHSTSTVKLLRAATLCRKADDLPLQFNCRVVGR